MESRFEWKHYCLYNPVRDKLHVEFAQKINCKISVLNYLGESIYVLDDPFPKQEIDISTFANGIYFIRLKTEEGQSVFKIVKD